MALTSHRWTEQELEFISNNFPLLFSQLSFEIGPPHGGREDFWRAIPLPPEPYEDGGEAVVAALRVR